MKLPAFYSPPLIGLDIQPDTLRLVQLKKSRHTYTLEHLTKTKLPHGIFIEGKIKNWDALSTHLTQLVHTLGIKGKAAAITLPANLVRMQRITLPSGLSETDIETEIYAQVQRDLPGMNDNLCVDFVASTQKNAAYSDIFFAAARQEYLSQYVECINSTGLKVKIVDVDIYALKRAISFALGLQDHHKEVSAILHITNNFASFIVFNAQEVIFNQQWDVIESTDLLWQIKNRIQIFTATFSHLKINTLAICCPNEYHSMIANTITHAWPVEISHPNPFAKLKIKSRLDAKHTPYDFLCACGAAMRELPTW